MDLTVRELQRRIELYLADGLSPDAPVIYLKGNPSVTAEGAVIPNSCGYYSASMGQRQALYLATDVRNEPSTPWDSRADNFEAQKKNWSMLFDLSFGGVDRG